jgi:hydroxymethylglutaryl-CoA synthase
MRKADNNTSMVGIVGYGAYIPTYRITVQEIANNWNQQSGAIKSGLLIEEKSVPAHDEDTVTIGLQAARNALLRADIDKTNIGAVYVGSESHPYAVKPSSTIVGTALGIGNTYAAADLEFACKAGSAAMQICYSMVKAGMIEYGLAIGADTAQGAPGDVLEYSASAAGAAFIMGSKSSELVAVIEKTISYSSDTPDFWRRNREIYPQHTHRFTGEPAYFKHVLTTTQQMLDQTGLSPKDFDYVIFHQPNGKFPLLAGKKLGFTTEQIMPGLVVTQVGNSYSASSPLSLTAILDIARPDQRILMTSYGSGSGCDSFVIRTTDVLQQKQNRAKQTMEYINHKKYISYARYRQHMDGR